MLPARINSAANTSPLVAVRCAAPTAENIDQHVNAPTAIFTVARTYAHVGVTNVAQMEASTFPIALVHSAVLLVEYLTLFCELLLAGQRDPGHEKHTSHARLRAPNGGLEAAQ
jgi:hypothetical protein